MGGEIIVTALIFGAIFGVFYLYFSTRNKERLALIEKGADASIFFSSKNRRSAPFWKVLILNLSLLLISIGVGVFLASVLTQFGVDEETAYPGTIFLMAGVGLFVGFNMTKKLERED
ncbi:DUF6249 domain-containing protein [Lentiprolixibacter aurantiacus]|uniref:DUF6249 domain-containing protein n=1 Tax=Lentiprolixibacter aurantiacus TaxID=2993939 RepID=A0AAE3MMH2_9FLAO|nr:DUF6249 domain-containing protein [Lentiprolixibacter aurantiacus]MCX2720169.1 hypothetical protein [Lentiprolixibacter aurantiacus]